MDMQRKILVRMPNWVGDLVMATPILTDLRRRFPQAEITAMCEVRLASLLEHDRDINELLTFSKRTGWEKKEVERSLTGKIRAGRYDIGILMTNSLSSAWRLWRGKVKRRIGFRSDWRSLLLTDAIPLPTGKHQHLVQIYKKLLEPLGIAPSNTAPRIHLLPEERAQAAMLLRKHGIGPDTTLIGVNPGAAYGSAKCWLPERFAEVTQRLLQDPRTAVVYFGDASQVDLVKSICNAVQGRVLNLAGSTSLRELAALLTQVHVLLTNDSGPMHVAAALGVPLLALFGSTHELKTGPYGQGDRVIHKHVECSPCYRRTCPIDFRCMTQITSLEVYERLKTLLESHVDIS